MNMKTKEKIEEIKATIIKQVMEADAETLTEPRILNFKIPQHVKQLYDNMSRRKKRIVKQALIEVIKALAGMPVEPRDAQPININMNVNVNEVKPVIKNESRVVVAAVKTIKKVLPELKMVHALLKHPSPTNIMSATKKVESVITYLAEERMKLVDGVGEA